MLLTQTLKVEVIHDVPIKRLVHISGQLQAFFTIFLSFTSIELGFKHGNVRKYLILNSGI